MENAVPLLADLMLLAAAIGAASYCMILSRRLTRLNSVDKGLGGAIAVLSAQVDDLTKVLNEAHGASEDIADRLASLITEAEAVANDIEQTLSVSHDFVPPVVAQSGPEMDETVEASEVPLFKRHKIEEPAE